MDRYLHNSCFPESFVLSWPSQNWESKESNYLNSSNSILPPFFLILEFFLIIIIFKSPPFVSFSRRKSSLIFFLMNQLSGYMNTTLESLPGWFFYDILEECMLNSAGPALAWEEISEPL